MIKAWRRADEPDAVDSMAVAETSVLPEGRLPGTKPELVPPQVPDYGGPAGSELPLRPLVVLPRPMLYAA
jgi:hypothetical protein